jgi:hypothetical protein
MSDCKEWKNATTFPQAKSVTFACGSLCVGQLAIFSNEEDFKRAVLEPTHELEALRISNANTSTIISITGMVSESVAAKIRSIHIDP